MSKNQNLDTTQNAENQNNSVGEGEPQRQPSSQDGTGPKGAQPTQGQDQVEEFGRRGTRQG
jgi:hypothetical protein